MRVLVALDDRQLQVGNNFYSHNLTYESFWCRYLDVFDSVLIIARVIRADSVPEGWGVVNREGISVEALSQYHGPFQYIEKMPIIRRVIRNALRPDDACILRISGNIGTQVWKQLQSGRPFGVEVMSDPWLIFAPGNIRHIGRPFYRWLWTRNQKLQCSQAAAVSYNTKHTLQQRYPANKYAFTTYYSDVELDVTDLCTDTTRRLEAISSIPKRLASNGDPVRLGFVGSFSQIHKLPHIHIKALAQCVAKRANLTLDMIGDGELLQEMKTLAKNLNVGRRVTFHGRIPAGQQVMAAMDTFDLFLNVTAAEGLPRVVIEAMARGCPCLASDTGGTPELIEPDYLVPSHDVNALANKILTVLKNPAAMVKAVKRNIGVARNYCKDVLQPRRRAFYQALRERTEKHLSERF